MRTDETRALPTAFAVRCGLVATLLTVAGGAVSLAWRADGADEMRPASSVDEGDHPVEPTEVEPDRAGEACPEVDHVRCGPYSWTEDPLSHEPVAPKDEMGLPDGAFDVVLPAAAVTSEQPGCRNSTDPACGDFFWASQPVNAPPVVTWETVPAQPVTGQPFELVIRWSDDGASHGEPGSRCLPVDSGGGLCADAGVPWPCDAYGAWEPAAPTPGSGEERLSFQFDEPGEYRWDYSMILRSVPDDGIGCEPLDYWADHWFVNGTFDVMAADDEFCKVIVGDPAEDGSVIYGDRFTEDGIVESVVVAS